MKISETTEQGRVSLVFSMLVKQNEQWVSKRVNLLQTWAFMPKDNDQEKDFSLLIRRQRHRTKQELIEVQMGQTKRETSLSAA